MTSFRLKVHRIQQTCIFELSWGKSQQLMAELPYPETLTTLYQDWQQTYFNFYHSGLLARVEMSGSVTASTIDWRAKLVQAEAKLLSEFYLWLSSAQLLKIRKAIESSQIQDTGTVDVFLTCEPLELARFPWETWELGTEVATAQMIRIARTPANIHHATASRSRTGRMRILAILGDDTGVDLSAARTAVKSLDQKIAEVRFVGWKQGEAIADLKAEIRQEIANPQGWDILFFTGHSNETMLTGGELAIAPGESMMIREIAPQLIQAKERGLQFAIFNSCNGLSIADSLIDLGLSQVAIMREPIHNQVAQEFLVSFLQSLIAHKDVHESLFLACENLKLERNLTYPSAYLIPSLFRHPDSVPFKRPNWRRSLTQWLPNRRETIALSALTLLSCLPFAQSWLLEKRIVAQSIYRQTTNQLPVNTEPPVLLVQIDNETLKARKIPSPNPMNRKLLADLVDRLSAARVIGIDYVLDRAHRDEDTALEQAIQKAGQKNTSFVFAAQRNEMGNWDTALAEIADPVWSLNGDIFVPFWYVRPLPWLSKTPRPFAYNLAIAHQLRSDSGFRDSSQQPLQDKVNQSQAAKDLSAKIQINPLTALSYKFGQRWLQPILDFSIPPSSVYTTISAEKVLNNPRTFKLKDQIVVIAPGGYEGSEENSDNFKLPSAIARWRDDDSGTFTGGEAHAYMIQHFLTQRLVIPIPDLWFVLIAAFFSKSILRRQNQAKHRHPRLVFMALALGYGLVCLQLYLTAMLLLPWFLPTVTVLIYALPSELRKKYA